uniref:Outer membrane protein beta-barrel domain-containing protein n=1 Tax=uncultured bacterium contig00147 TaxID=1181587 RepID=A0A806KGG9_9BACT|nr:hypothetical protein [uncultured bacterium contig00147]
MLFTNVKADELTPTLKVIITSVNGIPSAQLNTSGYMRVVDVNLENQWMSNEQKLALERQSAEQLAAIAEEQRQKQQQKERQKQNEKLFDDGEKLTSIGINAGTSFGAPWLLGNVNFTYPLIPGLHFEGGLDMGFIDGNTSEYMSMYGYARLCMFFRFKHKGGLYLGPGGGFLNEQVLIAGEEGKASINSWKFDLTAGIYIGSLHHLFRIGYAARTSFDGAFDHRVLAGYAYRFD